MQPNRSAWVRSWLAAGWVVIALFGCGSDSKTSGAAPLNSGPTLPAENVGGSGELAPTGAEGGVDNAPPTVDPGATGGSGGDSAGGATIGGNDGGETLTVALQPPNFTEPCPANAAKPGPNERPNFLWLVSEDNSPLLGAYGDKIAKTPNLDQLAREGVTYTNAFAVSPLCSASRASIFWGVHNAALSGVQDQRSKRDNVVSATLRPLAELIRGTGYYTTNNAKEDYNGTQTHQAWDVSSAVAHWRQRPAGKPFFAIFNSDETHESRIHGEFEVTTDANSIALPPYHPDASVIC